jgi:hypothetical protein
VYLLQTPVVKHNTSVPATLWLVKKSFSQLRKNRKHQSFIENEEKAKKRNKMRKRENALLISSISIIADRNDGKFL